MSEAKSSNKKATTGTDSNRHVDPSVGGDGEKSSKTNNNKSSSSIARAFGGGGASTPPEERITSARSAATAHRPAVDKDDRNVHSFRVANPTTKPSAAATAAAAADPSPPRAGNSKTHHQVVTRLKAVLRDAEESVRNHPQEAETMADDLVAIVEEAAKAFRVAKQEVKLLARRPTASKLPVSPPVKETARTRASENRSSSPEPLATTAVAAAQSGTRSYAMALLGRNKLQRSHTTVPQATSPPAPGGAASATNPPSPEAPQQHQGTHSADQSADDIKKHLLQEQEEERQQAALRGEEKQAEAEERRKQIALDRHHKREVNAERHHQVMARRHQQEERTRIESQEKTDRATKVRGEQLEKKKEFAQKDSTRVDEASFFATVTTDNRSMELEEKRRQNQQKEDQRREAQLNLSKEKAEARESKLDKLRESETKRREEQEAKISQKEEKARRAETAKVAEAEAQKSKREGREKKVQDNQAIAQAQSEERERKQAQRIEQSATIREERDRKQKEKTEKEERKVREAKERREKEDLLKPTYQDLMQRSTPEEEQNAWTKAQATMAKYSKGFLTLYAKENGLAETAAVDGPQQGKAKSSANSGFKAPKGKTIITKLGPHVTQGRAALHELAQMLDSAKPENQLDAADHVFLRAGGNLFATLLQYLADARKTKPQDVSALRLVFELLSKLLNPSTVEGKKHIDFFVRAGHFVPLAMQINDEIKILRKHNTSFTLHAGFSLLHELSAFLLLEMGDRPSYQTPREVFLAVLNTMNVLGFATSLASFCTQPDEFSCIHGTLALLRCQIISGAPLVVHQRPDEQQQQAQPSQDQQHQSSSPTKILFQSLLGLLSNIVTPGGQQLNADVILPAPVTAVMFVALRLLNDLTRRELRVVRSYLMEAATGQILYHVVSAVCTYIGNHPTQLERIAVDVTSAQVKEATGPTKHLSQSFLDAVDFGLTLLDPIPGSRPQYANRAEVKDGKAKSGGGPTPAQGVTVTTATGTTGGGATINEAGYLRAAFHELLLLIGYACADNTHMQDWFSYGTSTPLLSNLLSCLPVAYLGVAKHIVLPTLLCLCCGNERNRSIVEGEFDVSQLHRFLKDEIASNPRALKRAKKDAAARTPKDGGEAPNPSSATTQQRGGVSPPPPNTPPTPGSGIAPATTSAVSWADMMDDDEDDDSPFMMLMKSSKNNTPPQAAAPPPPPASGDSFQLSAAEDDLVRSIEVQKRTGSSGGSFAAPSDATATATATVTAKRTMKVEGHLDPLHHFRLDRRFPPALWPAALSSFEQQ